MMIKLSAIVGQQRHRAAEVFEIKLKKICNAVKKSCIEIYQGRNKSKSNGISQLMETNVNILPGIFHSNI